MTAIVARARRRGDRITILFAAVQFGRDWHLPSKPQCPRNCRYQGNSENVADIGETIQLDPNFAEAFINRGTIYSSRQGTCTECAYPLSPGGRYVIDEAFCMAASVSSTVSKTIVWMELSAPPAPIAIAVAAIETLSGASHKLYAS